MLRNKKIAADSGKADDPDHLTPELIDHLPPVLNICNCVDYTIKNLTGQKWSKLPVFALMPLYAR
jgi:hypothetical protein